MTQKALANLARIMKPARAFTLSHSDSSEGINRHHGSCHAVMHDRLPGKGDMHSLLEGAGLDIEDFLDEPGFYFIRAVKGNFRDHYLKV